MTVERVCVSFLLDTEYRTTHSSSKWRTFLKRGAILTGPHNLRGRFEGELTVLRLKLE